MILESDDKSVVLFGAVVTDTSIFAELVFYGSAIMSESIELKDKKGNRYNIRLPKDVLYQDFPNRDCNTYVPLVF